MKHVIPFPSQLSPIVKSYRKSLGLTQRDTGHRVGLLPKTISALENRPESASVESLFKLLSALELEMVLQPKKTAVQSGDNQQNSPEW